VVENAENIRKLKGHVYRIVGDSRYKHGNINFQEKE
jgi:hypothetical protein